MGSMITTPIRRLLFAVTLGAFLSLPLRAQEDRIVYEVRSQYQLISVVDTASGHRQMIFDGRFDGTDPIQSEMDLANPDELVLSYARHMMVALPLVEKPKRILIVGLGGACMQRFLYKLLPEATIETAEIDPEIREVASQYFFFKEDERQIVHIEDGRKFIEGSKENYDIIFLDAFSATSIPSELTTEEFFKAVKDHLAGGGVACANLWDEAADYPEIVKTYSAVFPEQHIVKCAYSGNSILLALPNKTGVTIQAWIDKARAFEKIHPTGLDLPHLIERGAAEKRSESQKFSLSSQAPQWLATEEPFIEGSKEDPRPGRRVDFCASPREGIGT
jgi:spermidine synthase